MNRDHFLAQMSEPHPDPWQPHAATDALDDIEAALVRTTGQGFPTERERMHPDQWEAEQRQAEKAELDRDFRRVYGDGR